MAKKWRNLKERMSTAARARVDANVRQTLESMALPEIRRAIGLTQIELAGKLEIGQGNISKLESAADMYLTTLRKYVEALGGELHLTAEFPGGRRFEIDNVGEIGKERAA